MFPWQLTEIKSSTKIEAEIKLKKVRNRNKKMTTAHNEVTNT